MKTNSLEGVHTILGLNQLRELADALSGELMAGDVVLLSGNLGAGKTTFTQFLGKALGVTMNITSPTYTLVGEYPILSNSNISLLIHADLYRRVNSEYVQEVIDSAVMNKAIVIIEWAEKLESFSNTRTWNISIESGNAETERLVTIRTMVR